MILTIGNLVMFSNEYASVTSVSNDKVGLSLFADNVEFDVNMCSAYLKGVPTIEYLRAICNGTEEDGEYIISMGNGFKIIVYNDCSVCIISETDEKDLGVIIPNHVLYVHDLQNLYHLLTGKQIQISEIKWNTL